MLEIIMPKVNVCELNLLFLRRYIKVLPIHKEEACNL